MKQNLDVSYLIERVMDDGPEKIRSPLLSSGPPPDTQGCAPHSGLEAPHTLNQTPISIKDMKLGAPELF